LTNAINFKKFPFIQHFLGKVLTLIKKDKIVLQIIQHIFRYMYIMTY
uniref:Transposase n=1 Tax=Strongyloides venezuelensis TaxID=75913 RepID=A0A0K0ETU7_STRVS